MGGGGGGGGEGTNNVLRSWHYLCTNTVHLWCGALFIQTVLFTCVQCAISVGTVQFICIKCDLCELGAT